MFSKILIANRGEIAVRVARTCKELGVTVVAVYSDVDREARHVALADEAVHLPGSAPADTYLNVQAVIDAALSKGCQAIHPGYGFMSERADVAEAVAASGLVWIGPPPEALHAAGDKVRARQLAESAGVSVVPGTLEPVRDIEEVHAFGDRHGYPIAIKAAGGGGGRGLKVAASAGDVEAAFGSAVREAQAYFGSADVYLERYLQRPKHVEIQILAAAPGQTIWLGARDCSLQRRHQKLVEETPPPRFVEVVPRMGAAAARVADACGYVNAGTVEFLLDADAVAEAVAEAGEAGGAEEAGPPFHFLEINARLQVEHTITEEVLGVDLVAAQLRIAAGDPLGFEAEDLRPGGRLEPRGHAIECRVNAEDPRRRFLPGPGRITRYREPGGPGIRVDSGFGEGDDVPAAYDSLVAKLVAWAPSREEARLRMLRALDEFDIQGIPTTIPAHRLLLGHPEFVDGSYSTVTVESGALEALGPPEARKARDVDAEAGGEGVLLVAGTPTRLWHRAVAGSVSAATRTGPGPDRGQVVAPMHGTILGVLVSVGDQVEAGDPVAVLEAMKMETHIAAPASGGVKELLARPGDVVEAGQVVAVVG